MIKICNNYLNCTFLKCNHIEEHETNEYCSIDCCHLNLDKSVRCADIVKIKRKQKLKKIYERNL